METDGELMETLTLEKIKEVVAKMEEMKVPPRADGTYSIRTLSKTVSVKSSKSK